MKRVKEIKSTRKIAAIICTVLSIMGASWVIILGATHSLKLDMIKIGPAMIPFNSLQGAIQTFTLMFCIMMACLDCYIGARMAYFIIVFLETATIVRMVMARELGPLPGALNGALSLVVVWLIGRLLRYAYRRNLTDISTGVFNKVGFNDGIIKVIREYKRDGKKGSIIYYQINNFRSINDEYGHRVGDKVLKTVADRISDIIGTDGDIGRFGGSEFAIVCYDKVDAYEMTKKIFEALDNRITVENDDIHMDIYVKSGAGIASFPKDENDNSKELFKRADIALMQAMKKTDENIAIFDDAMLEKMDQDYRIEQMIKEAKNNNSFFLEYQPQFAVNNKQLRGFESLIRMKDKDGNRVSPGDFIPVAEKSNLIFAIDEFVLNYVTREFASIVKEAKDPLIISVNISANGISRPEFVDIVKEVLEKNSFPSESLEIEITEYSFEDSQELTIKNIGKLKEMGVKVALDDFGTGYASISRLMNLSVDLLKVDKSLVDDIEKGEVNRDFISSISAMGHLVNCKVILEGVESLSQLEYIKQLECDYVQGYVWGKPMSFENAKQLIG